MKAHAPVPMPDINLLPLMPELLIALLAMALLLVTAWTGKERRPTLGLMSVIGLGAAAVVISSQAHLMPFATFDGMFVHDTFATFMKTFMVLATGFSLIMSWESLKRNDMNSGEYFILTLFALLGAMIMASAGDFLTLYLGLELMSLSIYVLAAFRRDDLRSNEAGIKYFILGSMASGILLYGISFIYGTSGTTSFSGIAHFLAGGPHLPMAFNLGVLMVVGGLSFKIAAAPFHMWAPDVYEGAPTPVTAFMAVLPKLAAFAAIYRVLIAALADVHGHWAPVLQLLAVLSLAVGAFAAIAQNNIKRMLAYSSIGHVGFLLIGVIAGSELGNQSVLVYLAIYIFMNLGAFAFVMFLNQGGIGDQIDDYKGLAHKRPLMAFIMALLMFSMAGVPPLAGFIGKFYVFMAAINTGHVSLAIIAVIFSAIGAFYYLRIVKLMYFDKPETEFTMPVTISTRAVLGVSTAVILVWGLMPEMLILWAEASVQAFVH